MLEKLFVRKAHLRHHKEAALLNEREEYLKTLELRGVQTLHLRRVSNMLLRIVEMLGLSDGDGGDVSVERLDAAAGKWSRAEVLRRPADHDERAARRSFLANALAWLRHLGRLDRRMTDVGLLGVVFERDFARFRYIAAPLFEERFRHLKTMSEAGMSGVTLRTIAEYQLHIVAALKLEKVRPVRESEVERMVRTWKSRLGEADHVVQRSLSEQAKFRCIARRWLNEIGAYRPKEADKDLPKEVPEYRRWIVEERGLKEITAYMMVRTAVRFMGFLAERKVAIGDVDSRTVDAYVAERVAGHARATIRGEMRRLRDFLRFEARMGVVSDIVWQSVDVPKMYQLEGLPSHVSWDTVVSIVKKSAEASSPAGIRGHAILTLFATYGMRSSELRGLRLGDIDWRAETIRIRRAKGGKIQTLPLLPSAGEALIRYIREVRRNESGLEEVFLCLNAPYRRMSASGSYHIVRTALDAAGANPRHRGPHCLRHSFATHLVNSGRTMKEVSDMLGHRSLESTGVYAKVDLESLRKVADMDLEGVL